MQRQRSRVIKAVIQALTRVNVQRNIPPVKYWNSTGSKGKSATLNDGLMQMFVQTKTVRQPMSATAKPEEIKYSIYKM